MADHYEDERLKNSECQSKQCAEKVTQNDIYETKSQGGDFMKSSNIKSKLAKASVTDLLDQWGRWSRSGIGSGSLEAPTQDNTHWISDDIAVWIDGAIGQLGMVDLNKRNLGFANILPRNKAVRLYYLKNHNIPMLANALKVGEHKARAILASGEGFIENHLGLFTYEQKISA